MKSDGESASYSCTRSTMIVGSPVDIAYCDIGGQYRRTENYTDWSVAARPIKLALGSRSLLLLAREMRLKMYRLVL